MLVAGAMGYLPRRAAHRGLNQPKRDDVIGSRDGSHPSPLTADMSYRTCVCIGGFWSCFGQYFLTVLSILLFDLAIYILCC